jgi:hypothetical protein
MSTVYIKADERDVRLEGGKGGRRNASQSKGGSGGRAVVVHLIAGG